MVALMAAEPLYAPIEARRTVAANTTLHADMETSNAEVINAVPAWKNAMASRNDSRRESLYFSSEYPKADFHY